MKGETVKEWTYRGRTCEVVKHRLGHYCGYVQFDDGDRHDGYAVDIDRLVTPIWDHYVPHGGITYRGSVRIGFDCGHAFDVCVGDDGEPLENTFLLHPGWRDNEMFNVWTVERVVSEVEELADQLPDRRPTCYECGEPLSFEWQFEDGDPPDCTECGENPLPPVGGSDE